LGIKPILGAFFCLNGIIEHDIIVNWYLAEIVSLPLWLDHNRLERGGRVFEPKGGLKSRAFTKPETHRLSETTPLSQLWSARR